jgi:hypothetical protein
VGLLGQQVEPQLPDLAAKVTGIRLAEARRVFGKQADEEPTRPKSRSARFSSQDRTSGSTSTSYKPAMHLMLYAADAIAKSGDS